MLMSPLCDKHNHQGKYKCEYEYPATCQPAHARCMTRPACCTVYAPEYFGVYLEELIAYFISSRSRKNEF